MIIKPICAFCFDYNLDNPDFIQNGICPRCRAEGITRKNMDKFIEIFSLGLKNDETESITISAVRGKSYLLVEARKGSK